MKTALLSLNGDPISVQKLRALAESCDTVIGVDGGTNQLIKAGIRPSLVIGDMDSIKSSVMALIRKNDIAIMEFPRDKDQTDAELACDLIIKEGAKRVIVVGFGGTRIDHMLAFLFHIASRLDKIEILLSSETHDMYLSQTSIAFRGKRGDTVSLIPLTSHVTHISTHGLIYALKNETLYQAMTRGVSNEICNDDVKIVWESGTLLAIHYHGTMR